MAQSEQQASQSSFMPISGSNNMACMGMRNNKAFFCKAFYVTKGIELYFIQLPFPVSLRILNYDQVRG